MINPTTRPLSQARAWTCVLTNLAATPGLGSVMAWRFMAGAGQLLLSLAGFALIVGWMFELCHHVYLQQLGDPAPPVASGWMLKWGGIGFGAGWLWSLATSVSLLRQAKRDGANGSRSVPPRMTGAPGQPPKLP